MTTSLTEERLMELRETFSLYDKDMNGSISIEELTQVDRNADVKHFESGDEGHGSKADKD